MFPVIIASPLMTSLCVCSCNNERRPPVSVLNFKTKPCTKFYGFGRCPYGEKCTFYHNKEEKNFPFYKNRFCKNFTSNGNCNLGSKCVYAHSTFLTFVF